FLCGSISGPEQEWIGQIWATTTNVYRALLVASLAPLPEPALSCAYLQTKSRVRMIVGAFGREWIITGAWKQVRWSVGNRQARRLNATYALYLSTKSFHESSGLLTAWNA